MKLKNPSRISDLGNAKSVKSDSYPRSVRDSRQNNQAKRRLNIATKYTMSQK